MKIYLEENQEIEITGDYQEITDVETGEVYISIDGSGITIKLNPDEVYAFEDEQNSSFTGIQNFTGQQLSQMYTDVIILKTITVASTAGDPHIDPIFGNPYELPMEPHSYRMLEGKNLFINTETRYVTKNEEQNIHEFYHSVTGNTDYENLITDGCFYKTVHISSENNTINVDLETKKLTVKSTKSYFSFKKMNIQNYNHGTYAENQIKESYKLSFNHSIYGKISIYIMFYVNPQINNGLCTRFDYDKSMHGLLINEYCIDDYTLPCAESIRKIENKSIVEYQQTSILKSF